MAVPDIRTPLPGPKAAALIARDAAVISPSYTRSYPLVIARGEGVAVEDVDGNVFLDCAAGIAVNSTGVSHPDVVKAERKTIETALKMGKHPRVELADISGAKPYLEMGVKHFCIGWDVRILYNWWRTNGAGMRAMLTGEAAVTHAPQAVKTGTY